MEEISFQDHYYSDIDEPGRLPGWGSTVSGTCTIPTNTDTVLYKEPDLIKSSQHTDFLCDFDGGFAFIATGKMRYEPER